MNGLELLERYPLTAKVVREWFLEKMIESLNDENVPDEFKDYMREQGVENDKLSKMIDVNPRMLLDVFDENGIVIETLLYPSKEFTVIIDRQPTKNSWKTRKEAELFAVEVAFEMLETKLTPPPPVEELEVIDEETVTPKEETDETDN
jgi:two-component SAPR family response regulator